MAEVAVSFVSEQLTPIVREEVNLLRIIHREFASLKDELESIRAFLKDADRRAEDEGVEREGIKTWVRQLREESFRIEDVIDDYNFYLAHRPPHPGCAAIVPRIARGTKTLKNRHQIASEIQGIKLNLIQIDERRRRYEYEFRTSNEEGSSSRDNTNDVAYDPRLASRFIEEAQVVGFEVPKRQLINWLLGGEGELTVISVVGMGGLGKTTLAKKVFDSQEVIENFEPRAWITVSQSYTIVGLLREMMVQFYKHTKEPSPEGLFQMDRNTLIDEVKNILEKNRYVICFDDIWNVEFWSQIERALPNNKGGSRIIITTRKMDVANSCTESALCHVHEQEPLSPDDAWKLFRKKTFRSESDGCCPPDLQSISKEIVRRCEGLPLAIVTIGGLLSTKRKVVDEWKMLLKNLSSELESNPRLSRLARILAFSYDDLPYYLKSCFLYFGIYPEDYLINCARLTKKWIAEGFVKHVQGKTLEEVAEGYITELMHRSLVQVSHIQLEGKAKSCRIHDVLREVVIGKMKDLNFARFVYEDDQSVLDTITRRLAIATCSESVLSSVGDSCIRAMYIFADDALPESFVSTFSTMFKHLKVLDFENALLHKVPDNLGKMFHLRYLSFRNTKVTGLPKSIGKLLNLETLDLRNTLVHEIPDQIKKLTKLRHLLVYHQNHSMESSITDKSGVKITKDVGCVTSLQKLYYVQVNHGGIDLIKELSKLKQLRKLGLKDVKEEYEKALCDSIKEMRELESLDITVSNDDSLQLHSIQSLPKLRRLRLLGRLGCLPEWIPALVCLVKLTMAFSKLNGDPLKSLENLPNLLDLSIYNNAYEGEVLHFRSQKFKQLKNMILESLDKLNSIVIDEGALPAIEQFEICSNTKLREVPSGICNLKSLQVLEFTNLPSEFNRSIAKETGSQYHIIRHVPIVHIRTMGKPKRGIPVYDTITYYHPKHSEASTSTNV